MNNKENEKICESIERMYSSRVNQLDSQSLDNELHSLIATKLNNIKLQKLKHLLPELEALIKLYIYWNTIHKNGISIGQSLLQLRYYDITKHNDIKKQLQKRQTYGIILMQIIFPWIRQRVDSFVRIDGIKNGVELIETFYNTINFINSLIFLYYGKYRSVWERFLNLGIGLQTKQTKTSKNELQFELMNRELLWHSFAEFLTFILPLINFYRVRNSFVNIFRAYVLRTNTKQLSNINERKLNDLKFCQICNEWPINAHEFGCKHVFCYYCLMSNFLSDQTNGFNCPKCLYKLHSIQSIKKVTAF